MGCTFALDPGLVREDASEPDAEEPDAHEPDAHEPDAREPDGNEPDADEPDAGESDAGELDAGDTGSAPIDPCDGGPCSARCSADDECASDEYCSLRIGGLCAARCMDTLGCAGPLIDESSQLESDEERVYIADAEEKDSLGNVTRPGRIRAWSPGGELVNLATDLRNPAPLFVAGDYLYYVEYDIGSYYAVERVALSGTEPPERIVERTRTAWATSTHVFWSVATRSTAELWRMPIAGTQAAEHVRSAAHGGWFSGNAGLALRVEQRDPARADSCYVVGDSLTNAADITDLYGPDYSVPLYEPVLALGDVFYIRPSGSDTAMRLDANMPGQLTYLPWTHRPLGKLRSLGSDVYWAANDPQRVGEDAPCIYLRTENAVGGTTSEIHRVAKFLNEDSGCPFVVLGSTLFFSHDLHLFSKEFVP